MKEKNDKKRAKESFEALILTRERFFKILHKVTRPLPKPPVQGKSKQEK